ncbi:tubulin-specific chaperone-like protein Rbl2 [Xylogone sp. PMI_703]|nr:tubulin-specific chaperone-like protein Rbl2 [Xylogone sp. PMI_703]
MAPPSQLAIATSSVLRLVKEEASYHKELVQQQAHLDKLLESKDEDENAEYKLNQERAAIEETKAVFPSLRKRIEDAVQKLEDVLDSASTANEDEVTKAKDAIQQAKAAINETL